MLHKSHKHVDHLSLWEPTLETYRRIAKEEDKTDRVDKAVELRRKIKALRKRGDLQQLLKSPSPEVYYDDVDMTLDRMGYLDNKYWREKENMSPEERERSEKFQEKLKILEESSGSFEEFISKVFSQIPLDRKENAEEDSDIDDSDSEDERLANKVLRIEQFEKYEEDDGDEEWEDEDTDYYDSEDEVDLDLWEDAQWECADLEDVCEGLIQLLFQVYFANYSIEIAGDIFETMAERANFNRESYEKGRNFMHRLVGKNINEKERKKLEKRQHQRTSHIKTHK